MIWMGCMREGSAWEEKRCGVFGRLICLRA